jgi:DNA-dependent metalloprotease WSS1
LQGLYNCVTTKGYPSSVLESRTERMPPERQQHNRVWTVNDLNDGGGPGIAALAGSEDKGGAPLHLTSCHHIPTLPSADQANMLLQRVVREFEGIARDRGYNVVSVSEMCCCGDGLDHQPGSRRKRRKQPDNVWGYNQWTSRGGGRKVHTIHLRLRHPSDHSKFLLYEDVAGTMAHELAHCEHGPHNDKFFKLMDEILEQHAVLMAAGLSRNGGYTMPAFGGSGHALGTATTGRVGAALGNGEGGWGGGASRPTPAQVRNARLRHLQQQTSGNHSGGGGYKLGWDSVFTQWMTPAQAAVVAAEARRRMQQLRLRGDRCCRPVTIDVDSDDDDAGSMEREGASDDATRHNPEMTADADSEERGEVEESPEEERKPAAVVPTSKRPLKSNERSDNQAVLRQPDDASKRPRGATTKREFTNSPDEENQKPSAKANQSTSNMEIIDLTGDEDEDADARSVPSAGRPSSAHVRSQQGNRPVPWTCRRCTYRNESHATNACTSCAMCETPRFPPVQEDDPTTRPVRLRVYK